MQLVSLEPDMPVGRPCAPLCGDAKCIAASKSQGAYIGLGLAEGRQLHFPGFWTLSTVCPVRARKRCLPVTRDLMYSRGMICGINRLRCVRQ